MRFVVAVLLVLCPQKWHFYMDASIDDTLRKEFCSDSSVFFLLLMGKLQRVFLAVIPGDQHVNEVANELWVGCCNVLGL